MDLKTIKRAIDNQFSYRLSFPDSGLRAPFRASAPLNIGETIRIPPSNNDGPLLRHRLGKLFRVVSIEHDVDESELCLYANGVPRVVLEEVLEK